MPIFKDWILVAEMFHGECERCLFLIIYFESVIVEDVLEQLIYITFFFPDNGNCYLFESD